jgi:excisionase family DNA binding protein
MPEVAEAVGETNNQGEQVDLPEQQVPVVAVPTFNRTGIVVRECYVDADDVAKFLKLTRRTILRWACTGKIPAHVLRNGERRCWRFKLSEVDGWMQRADVYAPFRPECRQQRRVTPMLQ